MAGTIPAPSGSSCTGLDPVRAQDGQVHVQGRSQTCVVLALGGAEVVQHLQAPAVRAPPNFPGREWLMVSPGAQPHPRPLLVPRAPMVYL